MAALSGPDHGRIFAMPHKAFLEKQQERSVVPRGQYVPAARRQGSGTQEKRRHTSKATAHRQNEGRSAAESRGEYRRSGLPMCAAVRFCPAAFRMRELFPCRPKGNALTNRGTVRAPSVGLPGMLRVGCGSVFRPHLLFVFSPPRGFSHPAHADRPSAPSFPRAGDPPPLFHGRAPAGARSRSRIPPSAFCAITLRASTSASICSL